ncbi:histidine kinase, partial [Streptomyces sp. T-3]|nr:histidine kinase [Streptomyces sp. T-3]
EAPGAFGWRRAVLGDRVAWRAVGCALAVPFTAVLALGVAVCTYVYGVLFVLHPLLKNWNYHLVRDPDGSTRRVSLEIGDIQLDSWPRWLLVVAAGVVLLVAAPWLLRRALIPHRLVLRTLLGPDRTEHRIRTLEETRAHAVDDAAATLRRIERDLHDGTQARLVGLGMQLTIIRELLTADADRAQVLAVVSAAQGSAKQSVAELRDLVRGIHPPVLDQGLGTALATLAADSALPVTLTADLQGRASPAIESIAYFCAAELLTNVIKHSGAGSAEVDVTAAAGQLRLAVRDDGRGGAAVGGGSGLRGLLDRVRTVDGTLECVSPAGGPTVVTVVLPYA